MLSMIFPDADWRRAHPEAQGGDSARLEQALSYLQGVAGHDGVREVVVVREGRLVHAGEAATRRHGVHSITKIFTSTAFGLLVGAGKLELDTKAHEIYPRLKPHYPEVTLRRLASMTSGYRAVGDLPRPDGYRHGTSFTFLEPHPEPLFAPGTAFAYWDSAANLFAYLLTRVAGRSLYDLVQGEVGEAIGWTPSDWGWGDYGQTDGVWLNSGSGNYDQHVAMNALALARLGRLYLNGGRWRGERLLPVSFVKAATSAQTSVTMDEGVADGFAEGRGVYGLGWWVNGLLPDGKRKFEDAPAEMFVASGYNNDLFVLPTQDIVVVRLGLDQCDTTITDEAYSTFLRLLLAALKDQGVIQV